MNPTLDTIEAEQTVEEKRQLVPLFEIYVDQTFGDRVWDHLMTKPEFLKLLIDYFPRYGDLVFREVVDTVANAVNTPIQKILKDFGTFINTYYP